MVTPQTKGKDGSHPVKILALESSAVAASAALCEDETLIAQAFQNSGLTHSQTLLCGLRRKNIPDRRKVFSHFRPGNG